MNNKNWLSALTIITILIINHYYLNAQTVREIDSLLNRAYSIINTNPKEAIELFETASMLDPQNVLIKKQLGYLSINQKNFDNALKYFISADQILPSDTTKLQIAYLLNTLNRNSEALDYFYKIRYSDDPDIRSKAQSAIIVLEANKPIQKFPWWGEIYTSPYFDNRFHTIFNFLQIKEGYYLTTNKTFSILGTLQITSDTKSKSTGQVPEIFSDNAVIFGAGLNYNPFVGLNLIAQTGIAIDLIKTEGKAKIKQDFRTILSYGNGFYPEISIPSTPEFVFKPLADLYGSFGYYSRYKNSIGYASLKGGFRFFEWRKSSNDFYLKLNFAMDIEKEYYNNIIESGAGLKFIPDHSIGLSLLVEFLRGKYLITPPIISRSSYYNSFRFYLIYGGTL